MCGKITTSVIRQVYLRCGFVLFCLVWQKLLVETKNDVVERGVDASKCLGVGKTDFFKDVGIIASSCDGAGCNPCNDE
jgi:hypothetical protein